MKQLLTKDFLLDNDFTKNLQIIDYHNNLSPKQIAEDIRFGNITQAWLYGGHYK